MSKSSLLSNFALLMRASRLDEMPATEEEVEPDPAGCSEEDGHRLVRAFLSIRDAEVRRAVLEVVAAIAAATGHFT